jgi:dephospho-CoA kinase
MRRPGMDANRFAGILRAQLPDPEKRRRADFVVVTALSRRATLRRLGAIVEQLRHGGLPRRARRGRAVRQLGGRADA